MSLGVSVGVGVGVGVVVDAYCGLGAFAWALRDVAGRVVGLEENAEAVAAGYRFYSYGDATYLEVVRDQAGAPPPRQVPP